jgi:hypothetical protein
VGVKSVNEHLLAALADGGYEDGTITEHWNVVDVAGLLAQLGAA